MSVTSVKLKNRLILWGKSAGRCEYEGCNLPLWIDSLTKIKFNTSYIAHIVADVPKGPRGDKVLSEKLKNDVSNLMLLCDVHHRLVDVEDVKGHTVARLQAMKRDHEDRIEILSSISNEKRSHVLLYGANIGKNNAKVTWQQAANAMTPRRFPAEENAFELSLINSSFEDNNPRYWEIEKENLKAQFNQKVKQSFQLGSIKHLSVFALAPQPLLIELGRLLSDIPDVDVYQLHREPKQDWSWQESPVDFNYIIKKSDSAYSKVAIIFSLSATIDEKRIRDVLGEDVSIWIVTIDNPDNDFLKGREQLMKFRELLRKLFDEIKAKHGHENVLHVFPAVPVAIAVEIGRVWMPKADLPLWVYDENRGFSLALTIK